MRAYFIAIGVAGSLIVMLFSIRQVYRGYTAGERLMGDFCLLHMGIAAVAGVVPAAILLLPLVPIWGAILCAILLLFAAYAFAKTPRVLGGNRKDFQ